MLPWRRLFRDDDDEDEEEEEEKHTKRTYDFSLVDRGETDRGRHRTIASVRCLLRCVEVSCARALVVSSKSVMMMIFDDFFFVLNQSTLDDDDDEKKSNNEKKKS